MVLPSKKKSACVLLSRRYSLYWNILQVSGSIWKICAFKAQHTASIPMYGCSVASSFLRKTHVTPICFVWMYVYQKHSEHTQRIAWMGFESCLYGCSMLLLQLFIMHFEGRFVFLHSVFSLLKSKTMWQLEIPWMWLLTCFAIPIIWISLEVWYIYLWTLEQK